MRITHILYGSGDVISADENYVKIKFDNSEKDVIKMFPYPEAFEKFLTYEDQDKQAQALSDLHAKQTFEKTQNKLQAAEELKQKEHSLAKRMEQMKLSKKRK
jgi:hypothetical protein